MEVYSGYIKDKNKLLNSASGGVATSLSEKIIENGGSVFGVRYTKDYYRAEYCCVENLADLEQLKGSKYLTSEKGEIYKQVEEKLVAKKTVLYIGLGCDIAAVKAYCKTRNIDVTNLYTIDILCHGPAEQSVHEKFVRELETKINSKITYYTIRYKKDGWTPFYIKAVFDNGYEYIEQFAKSDFGKAFYKLARPVCTQCKFKGSNHQGDLCIGDFWGLTKEMPGWNENGVSIMIVQSEKGQKLMDMLKDDFIFRKEDSKFVIDNNPMYSESRKQKADYNKFMNDMELNGLHYAVDCLPKDKISFKQKIKNKIKKIIKR